MIGDKLFTCQQMHSLVTTRCRNFANEETNLLAMLNSSRNVLDHQIVERDHYAYFKDREACKQKLAALRPQLDIVLAEMNKHKDIGSTVGRGLDMSEWPDREKFQEAFCVLYSLFSNTHYLGQRYREYIRDAFKALSLDPPNDQPMRSGNGWRR